MTRSTAVRSGCSGTGGPTAWTGPCWRLRYREPVFESTRELALSYFEQYYNVEREKTLRGCTVPLDLRRLDSLNWMSSDDRLEELVERVDRLPWRRLITEEAARGLRAVDECAYRAGLLGADPQGLFRPD